MKVPEALKTFSGLNGLFRFGGPQGRGSAAAKERGAGGLRRSWTEIGSPMRMGSYKRRPGTRACCRSRFIGDLGRTAGRRLFAILDGIGWPMRMGSYGGRCRGAAVSQASAGMP